MNEKFAWNLYMAMSLMDIWNDYTSNVLYYNRTFSLYLLVSSQNQVYNMASLAMSDSTFNHPTVADAQDTRESEKRRKDSRNATDNCSCTPLDRHNPKTCSTKSGTDRLSLQSPV